VTESSRHLEEFERLRIGIDETLELKVEAKVITEFGLETLEQQGDDG
jgi:hypothetical protein